VVELCKKRSGALNVEDGSSAMGAADGRRFDSQSPQLSGPSGLWRELASSDSREGGLAERSARWLMRNIMSSQADRLGRELNVLPGAEFRQAVISGREVGAEIVLGDRPIDITLKRSESRRRRKDRITPLLPFSLRSPSHRLSLSLSLSEKMLGQHVST